MTREIGKYFKLSGNENTAYQHLQGAANSVRRKFIPLNVYVRKEEGSKN